MKIQDEFKLFIENCTDSSKSSYHYSSDFKKFVNERLGVLVEGFTDIYDYTDPDIVEDFKNKLEADEIFIETNRKGNNMYKRAVSLYLTFLKDRRFFSSLKEERVSLSREQTLSFQRIYYGAPGTGKSHRVNELTEGENVIRTTFHPDSDYSTFVGAYKPTTIEVPVRDVTGKVIYENGSKVTETRIIYEFVAQAFLQAYVNAWKFFSNAGDGEKPKKQFLVIEEINRGNCAQIFGDLFQLLDRNDSGFSEYPINADKDLQTYLAKEFGGMDMRQKDSIDGLYKTNVVDKVVSGEILLLPSNLYIWATMNTSDQSLFPIDSAFKRRWDWMYVPIANAAKGWKIEVGKGVYYDLWDFLEKINKYIYSTTNSADKQLGYFFCKADSNNIISAETFVNKVVFYLWNDVFKDYGFDDRIFADNDDREDSRLTFGKFYSGGKDGLASVVAGKVAVFIDNLEVKKFIEEVDESASNQDDLFEGDKQDIK